MWALALAQRRAQAWGQVSAQLVPLDPAALASLAPPGSGQASWPLLSTRSLFSLQSRSALFAPLSNRTLCTLYPLLALLSRRTLKAWNALRPWIALRPRWPHGATGWNAFLDQLRDLGLGETLSLARSREKDQQR